jgi:hypothetical protein
MHVITEVPPTLITSYRASLQFSDEVSANQMCKLNKIETLVEAHRRVLALVAQPVRARHQGGAVQVESSCDP